jgi:hypothetical protein
MTRFNLSPSMHYYAGIEWVSEKADPGLELTLNISLPPLRIIPQFRHTGSECVRALQIRAFRSATKSLCIQHQADRNCISSKLVPADLVIFLHRYTILMNHNLP